MSPQLGEAPCLRTAHLTLRAPQMSAQERWCIVTRDARAHSVRSDGPPEPPADTPAPVFRQVRPEAGA